MVKTIITPDHNSIEVAIPVEYVGKQLEVLVYTVAEVDTPPVAKLVEPKRPQKPSDFKGILSAETADDLLVYLKKSREEWQQRIL